MIDDLVPDLDEPVDRIINDLEHICRSLLHESPDG